ncbi:hypothetical protein Q7545_08740, partial [Glaesserella parasuis]|uniref:hypothetical protein n=1 Tax=Glaesserella parasuis TaxID=738 RepID=UPI0027179F03|nr:hypothetical protein [Glaesserella parasuis]
CKNFFLKFFKMVAKVFFGGFFWGFFLQKGGFKIFPPPPPPLSLRQLPPQAGGAKALGKIS